MNRNFSDQELVRHQKIKELVKNNKNPYALERVKKSHTLDQVVTQYKNYEPEKLLEVNESFLLVGRVMGMRQTFLTLKEKTTKLQIYFNKKHLSEEILSDLKNYVDIGDLLAVEGKLFFTKLGELTLNVQNFKILAKSLHPLPEKFHGLKDVETKLRKRYLDAIINDELLVIFQKRSIIISAIRQFLNSKDYLEVETPILQQTLGGAAARPFITHHNTLGQNFYLRIATEIPLKKMIVAGFDKIYEIGRCFRNEGMDATHNPEFTSLEMYTAFDGMDETMEICEAILRYVINVLKLEEIEWNNYKINLSLPFKKIAMHEMVFKKTGVDFYHKKISLKQALKLADEYQINLLKHEETVGHIFNKLFETLCESELVQPTFVYGHHKDVSPLAKIDPKNSEFTLRFELFIGTKEIANGFAELNDPIDQLARFKAQAQEAELGNTEANEIDYEFVNALEYGLVPTGGLGIGIDRLVMLLTGQNTIRNVIFFPHLRKESN